MCYRKAVFFFKFYKIIALTDFHMFWKKITGCNLVPYTEWCWCSLTWGFLTAETLIFQLPGIWDMESCKVPPVCMMLIASIRNIHWQGSWKHFYGCSFWNIRTEGISLESDECKNSKGKTLSGVSWQNQMAGFATVINSLGSTKNRAFILELNICWPLNWRSYSTQFVSFWHFVNSQSLSRSL